MRSATRSLCALASLCALVLSATTVLATPKSTEIDRLVAERALLGAEWIAAQAESLETEPAADRDDPREWLLQVRAASEFDEALFARRLAEIGYQPEELAEYIWFKQFEALMSRWIVFRAWPDPRPLWDIEAEIASLPTVPLDEAGAMERQRLMAERYAATFPERERAALEAVGPRLEGLLEASRKGSGQ